MSDVSLLELRTRLREMTDTENDKHVSDAELNKVINSAARETWDRIAGAGLQGHGVKYVDFSTTPGTQEYSLKALAPDFYKVHQLFVNDGNGQFRPITRIHHSEVMTYRPPQTSVSLRLYYIPTCPKLVEDTDTFDGVNGWEEHTLNVAAIHIKRKKLDDASEYFKRKQELEQRIVSMGNADWSEPSRVVRRRHRKDNPFWVYQNDVNAWVLRGDNIELFYHYGAI
jgi:hypothetical protein